MNVYVRELASALAQAGVACDVFTRAESAEALAVPVISIEPGLQVVHIEAGPAAPVPKEDLPEHLGEFTAGVREHLVRGEGADLIHANYWMSGVAGHQLKHELGLPLISTFHTLARVKAEADLHEPPGRARAEAEVIGCSDAILVSCPDEAAQLTRLYDADPSRLEVVPPGVLHAFFSPGDRFGARRALGLGSHPVLLFVGRIQPLKGLDVAIEALAELREHPDAVLVVVGGASGADGPEELERVQARAEAVGVAGRVRFVPPQPHHLLSTYYRAANVVVVPSRSESFGLVALEAAACGTPVVAAAVGGLRTLVDDGGTGFLVEGREPSAFAAAAATVLGNAPLAGEMGERAAHRARWYTWSTSAARLRRLYADLGTRAPVACR